ncbi:hypothetical protein [Amphibacillus indicireducens]|uniref:Bypass of forespore C C-terminal domain-containing protein n=1 Tax=Amphibacillus indicireducens TaxID=1076330 RepID=A0ABP7V4D7_9BACI
MREKSNHHLNKAPDHANDKIDDQKKQTFSNKQRGLIFATVTVLVILIIVLIQSNSQSNSKAYHADEAYQNVERKITEKNELDQIENPSSTESNVATYEEQIAELGELPEGHIILQDIDGTVSYISEEEYNKLLNQDVRENTVADETADPKEVFEDIEIEIMPADDFVWHQTRGQFIYFVQKAVPMLYAQNILAADFDTNTYVMEILLDIDSTFELPNDFEDRMLLAYQNSGYQVIAPDQLTIEYVMGNLDEFLENY